MVEGLAYISFCSLIIPSKSTMRFSYMNSSVGMLEA